jgi:regulator of protease activity HflC (stomatin/prohibitin superfamily)
MISAHVAIREVFVVLTVLALYGAWVLGKEKYLEWRIKRAAVAKPARLAVRHVRPQDLTSTVVNGVIFQAVMHKGEKLLFRTGLLHTDLLDRTTRTRTGPEQEAVLDDTVLDVSSPPPSCQVDLFSARKVRMGAGFRNSSGHLQTAAHVFEQLAKSGPLFYIASLEDGTMLPVESEAKVIMINGLLDEVHVFLPNHVWSSLRVKQAKRAPVMNSVEGNIHYVDAEGAPRRSSGTVTNHRLTGYVAHNINTLPGMSGSPILDAKGRVIATHLGTVASRSVNYGARSTLGLPMRETYSNRAWARADDYEEAWSLYMKEDESERDWQLFNEWMEDEYDRYYDEEDNTWLPISDERDQRDDDWEKIIAEADDFEEWKLKNPEKESYHYMRESANADASTAMKKRLRVPIYIDLLAMGNPKLNRFWVPLAVPNKPWNTLSYRVYQFGTGEVASTKTREIIEEVRGVVKVHPKTLPENTNIFEKSILDKLDELSASHKHVVEGLTNLSLRVDAQDKARADLKAKVKEENEAILKENAEKKAAEKAKREAAEAERLRNKKRQAEIDAQIQLLLEEKRSYKAPLPPAPKSKPTPLVVIEPKEPDLELEKSAEELKAMAAALLEQARKFDDVKRDAELSSLNSSGPKSASTTLNSGCSEPGSTSSPKGKKSPSPEELKVPCTESALEPSPTRSPTRRRKGRRKRSSMPKSSSRGL